MYQAYDQHLNMILGDVEEIVTTVEIDDETYEEIVRVRCNPYCSPLGYFPNVVSSVWSVFPQICPIKFLSSNNLISIRLLHYMGN